ncbi:aminopeptidase N-like [Nylanderia fulva]|uniref:aminopeptidase N-like n=1 Tax=Nylanderia fulva TaxID=613905 RepID=UPI0010FB87CD|nr:aminopeptidase N-like [Nylanderia fulva]XP_029166523.1 aminopeptidase N-like [Nylanderia fulva]
MMIFPKLLLSSGLIFITVAAFIRNESSCYQPSKYVKPMHYDIKLITYIQGNLFYGEYNISISILNKTQHILLHSEKLCIKSIILFTNVEKNHENDTNIVYKLTYSTTEDTIDIIFKDELLPGNYTLNIKYYGTADEVFIIFDEKIALVAATHFYIIGTRRLSSCWDEQNLVLEATFNISIGCKQCTALSNMPLRNMEKDERNLLWTHFDTTPAMSPYFATMIVSNYLLRIDSGTRNIKMWCRDKSEIHIHFAKNVAEKITLHFKNEWKRSCNISKVTHVAIPNFHDNGTIVFGLVLHKETDVIYDKNLYPIAHKVEVAQLVGRKVTKQWFNNMLNNPFVSDFWFKKGLTTLLATYAVNKTYPDYRIINLFVVQNQHYSFNLDSNYYMWNSSLLLNSSILQVNSLLEIPNSIRAPFIMRMMQHAFEQIFWKNIRTYANSTLSHRLGSVNIMKDVALKMNIAEKITRMEYWASEKHCPLIKVERSYSYFMNQTTVSVQYIDILEICHIPITFTTEASPNFYKFIHHFLHASQDFKLSLPFEENGWMIFNIQQVGYYRVNYDDENWRRISNYLNSDNYTKIHVLNRAQIIDDAFHLMIAGQLQFHIFWDIIKYLHREEDYIAWYPMFKALEYIFNIIPVTSMFGGKIENFTSRVRHALHKLLERIKYEEIDDIDRLRICLRQEAARWACFLGDIDCQKEAKNKLEHHLQDPTKHKLMPWWKEWTFCNGLMTTNNKTWRSMYTMELDISDTKFEEYLACLEDINIIIDYLKYKSINIQKFRYLLYNFLYIIAKHVKNPTFLDYLLHNFLEIKPKFLDITAAFIIIINNVYSVHLIQEINGYVEWLKRNANLIDEIKEKDFLMQKIERKISIRKNQIERRTQYFDHILL